MMSMLNNFFCFDSLFILFSLSLVLNKLVIFLWRNKMYRYLGVSEYQAMQRIHTGETPRLGGLVIIILLLSYGLLSTHSQVAGFTNLLLLCLSPSIFFALKEDLFYNVKPLIRFTSLLFSGFLFVVLYKGPWPQISFPFIGDLLSTRLGIIFLYPLGMVAVSNGMNFIDGVNGLCAMVAISILCILLSLSHFFLDLDILIVASSLIILLISFLVFNYPNGNIFLGDLGSYSIGMIISILTITFYGRHPELPSWGAILILIYPLTEVSFSIVRRLKTGVDSFESDLKHLHLLIYLFYKHKAYSRNVANALVTPILSMLWLFPLITPTWFYKKTFFIIPCIAIFIFLYILAYKKFQKP